ncbi:MAG TPA: bifunctional UDP-sugar hydrolase/5'-nucleotidase [Candidatus Ozemobacteraceae bacterium]
MVRFPSLRGSFALLLLTAVLFLPSALPAAAAGTATSPSALPVTILYTNDHHSHLTPTDLPEFGAQLGGMARRYEMIRAIRASEPRVLLLDGGDIFQGSPFYSFFKGRADIAAYSLCGYDATTLGNHDLDDGLSNNIEQYKKAEFPLLCANVANASDGSLVFPPFRIIERGGLRIGVAGIIGSSAWEVIAQSLRRGLRLIDPTLAATAVVAVLRPQTDLVVLLSHSGYERDLELAARVPGIDVIIGGHTNTYVESPTVVRQDPVVVPSPTGRGFGTIVLQAFKWGAFLGRLDLLVERGGPVVQAHGGLIPLSASVTVPLDSPMTPLIESFAEQIRARTTQVVGHCAVSFPYPEKRKHLESLPLGSLVAQSLIEFTGADLAIINSGCIREPLPEGPVTMGRIFSILPFDNTVVTMEMRGADILDMLGFICAQYGAITGYQYAGATFTFDVAARKLSDARIGGKPIDPGHTYRVVTISYLADGNQHGTVLFRNATNRRDDGYYYREAFLDYVHRHGTISLPPVPSPLRLVGAEGLVPTYDKK